MNASFVRIALLSVSLATSATLAVFAAHAVIFPAYTDAEIQASIVDTWEVQAMFTMAALVLLAVIALLTALLRWRASPVARRLSSTSLALCVLTAILLVAGHIVLTERTTRLTGQGFGGFHGLF